MLKNRSGAAASSSKTSLMADQISLLSPTKNITTSPNSSFLSSPRFFTQSLSDASMSPTSILDAKLSSSFVNPFGRESFSSKPSTSSTAIKNSSEAIGLALIDSIEDKTNNDVVDGNFCKPVSRMVLSGSKLKVQIPSLSAPASVSPADSPKSPADFGIKTRNSQFPSPFSATPKRAFSRQLSLKEMELSEDYTRVISHGPNPKTTHIFDDCIVESCSVNDTEISDHKTAGGVLEMNISTSPSTNFLSYCYTCKVSLELGKDIYMYRGEKAFCSHECRFHEMSNERKKNPSSDDAF